jgi:two-component system, NtrC family, response regulator GlrR
MGKRRRILLVDDDPQVLFVFGAGLRGLGIPCDVVTAHDGGEAYRLLQAGVFDLLVTVVRLPGIDGVTLTSFVRSAQHWLPVVWITAHGCRVVQADAARLGVYRCLAKPIEISVLRQVAEQAMNSRRLKYDEPRDEPPDEPPDESRAANDH